MQTDRLLTFGSYRLDPQTGQLWRGKQEVRLTGKASAVLRYLVERAGQVVTKEELFAAVWPETVVSDAALSSCIQEVRQVLREQAKRPRYIATVHRRGFQFIGNVASGQYPVVSSRPSRSSASSLTMKNGQLTTPFVGRDSELAQLHSWLKKALNGERQIVFVSGEVGIGKTTMVEAFLQTLDSRRRTLDAGLWIGRGQCVEHYGAGEAYLPVLEALGRLCREENGKDVIALLRHQAPTWLVQMPALLSTAELEELQRRTAGVTRERMLRELAEALEALTAERALILRLEDLHWSDYSTLDLLSVLARRQEAAQLLILGTYRPVEVLARDHPLKGVKQELQLHGQCEELALDFLSEAAVGEYLVQRFNGGAHSRAPFQRLAHHIHQRTDGNPLFMVNVVNDLIAQGVLVRSDSEWELKGRVEEVADGVPEGLQQMIEQQVARLRPETQRMLEVASVAGAEFSAATVAAGLETEIDVIEEQCEALVRREQFLRACGTAEWPDETVAARYGFLHALYQDVLYHRLTARRRQRLHKQIGEREEKGYGEQAREIAAELALHFERGREYRRAIQYLQQAGENTLRRSANQEAVSLLTKGLELLKTLPDTPERAQQELTLQLALNDALVTVKGYAALEVENTMTRARALFQRLGETPQLFPVLWRLFVFYTNRGELRTAHELAEELLRLAQSAHDWYLLSLAHAKLGATSYWRGELVSARTLLEQALALYDPQSRLRSTLNTADHRVDCLSYASWTLWCLGYPDQALKRSQEALTLAAGLSHPFTLAYALGCAAIFHLLRREGPLAQEQAEAGIILATEQGFPYWSASGTIVQGWALAEQGQVEDGIAQMQQGLVAFRAIGVEGRPNRLAQLAWAYGQREQTEGGLAILAEALALVDKTGERVYEAELYRLKGELTLKKTVDGRQSTVVEKEAEGCFWTAIEIARRQQAKSLELRATVSLARLWQQQGKQKQAHKLLAEIYNWFTEGFDTKDLQEAKALLKELS